MKFLRICIFMALALLAPHLVGAQISANGSAGFISTAYTNGSPNNDIYIWCGAGNNGDLTYIPISGTAPFTFQWYQFSSTTFSWISFSSSAGVSSTVSSLASGGYRVQVTDANGQDAGCDIAWVWNINPTITLNTTVSGCQDVNLSCVLGNMNFTYYNPPNPQAIIDANTDITVCFTGNHTWVSDLGFYLQGPTSCGSPLIALSPNPGSVCNAGNNFNNLCFTTNSAPNFNVCSEATPLTGTFDSYNGNPINWSGLYGCNAAQSGWTVRVFDCEFLDSGVLTNATITFSNLPTQCGSNGSITYNSGTINSAINDNSCSPASSSSFVVPPPTTLTTPIVLSASSSISWTTAGLAQIQSPNSNTSLATSAADGDIFSAQIEVSIGTSVCTFNQNTTYSNPGLVSPNISYATDLCVGNGLVNVSLTGANGGTFTAQPAGLSLFPNGNIQLNSSAPGTYQVLYSVTTGGCTLQDAVALTIQDSPNTIQLSPGNICEGAVFNGSSSTADLYEYFLNGVSQASPNSNSITTSPALLSGDDFCVRGYNEVQMNMDGIFNESSWGIPLSMANSSLVSSFGDQNHADALYITQVLDQLYLGVAGALVAGSNNRIFIFLDVNAGGFSSLSAWVNRSNAPYFSMSALSSSIQFDAGFTPEYILAMNTASDGISYFDLYNMTTNSNQYLGSSVSNPDLSYTSAGSVINTGQGYEFSFPLTALGNPTGEIGLFTMLVNDPGSNSNPTLVSNQFLTPAENGALSYGTGSIDFGAATPDPIHYIIADNNCYAEDCLILDVPSSLTLPNIPDQCVNASSAPVLNTTISGISGTWSPSAIDVSAPVVGAIYSFTPNAGACAVGGSITVDVNAPAVPVFSIANQYCQGDLAPALPNSDGSISGTWSPSIIATSAAAAVSPIDYVFTPTSGQCASDFTLSVNVTPSQIPTFSFLTSLCQNATAPNLPLISDEGIAGSWSGSINTSVLGNQILTFTPNAVNPLFQCPVSNTVNISITNGTMATFAAIGPFCSSDTPSLPAQSAEGFTGVWNPTTIDMSNTSAAGTNYIFTPDPGQCGIAGSLNVVILSEVTPSFNAIGPLCLNATAPVLNTVSNNGINGTWNPSIVQTSTAGNATYTFTPDANECASSANLSVVVNAPTLPSFNVLDTYCQGAAPNALPLNSINAVNGTWTPASISTAAVGSSSYVFNPNSSLCASSFTLNVTIEDNVQPTFSAIGPLCINSVAVILPTSSLEGIVGTWNVPNVNTSIAGTTNYVFTHSPGICALNTNLNVTIESAILPLFDAVGPLCELDAPPNLPGVSNNGFTGTWNPSVIDMSSMGNSVYSFTPDPGQCASNATLNVNVTGAVDPLFSFGLVYCEGQPADLLPAISDDGIAGTWLPNAIQTNTAGLDNYVFTPNAGLCATPVNFDVTVNSPQSSSFSNLDNVLCQGSNPAPLSLSSDEGYQGSWIPAAINTGTPGNFDYVFTPNAAECALSFTYSLQIDAPSDVVFGNLTDAYCQNEATDLLPSDDDNGISGSWFPSAINSFIPGNANFVFTPDAGLCYNDFDWSCVIHPLPTADFNTSLPAITCNDAEVDITVSGGVSYQWSDGLGNSDVVTVTDDATISVIVTDEYSCESTASISVPYDTSSFAIIDVATTTLNCAVLDIDLDIIGGSIFQWYDVISDSSSISISTPGVYGAHVTHDNGCSRDVYITIDQDITPPTIQIQNLTGVDTLTCLTTEIQLQALGGVSYTWNNGMGNGAIANVVNPGEYIVVGTGANFCTSDTSYSISQNIVQPTPSLSGSDNLLDCFVDSILMVASGGVNYSWNLSALTDDSLMVTLPGNYEVTVFAPNGCSSTAQWNVGLNRYSPDSAFVYSPQVIMDEDALVNLDGPSINGVAYQWTIDDDVVFNGDDFTYTFGSFSPGVHEVCMRAFVSELCKSDSCQQIEIFESLQLFLPTSFTPGNDGVNDGYSPVFSNIDLIENYDLVIFNRWGEVLFHSVNPTESWDGNYKEDGMYYVPDGSYPYILNYKTYRDIEMITVKGNIVIVR